MKSIFSILLIFFIFLLYSSVYGDEAKKNTDGENIKCTHEHDDKCTHENNDKCTHENDDKCTHEHDDKCTHENNDKCTHENNDKCTHENDDKCTHENNGGCNMNYHDSFIMNEVMEEPWRHPDKLKNDLWLRTGGIFITFIILFGLRIPANKYFHRKWF